MSPFRANRRIAHKRKRPAAETRSGRFVLTGLILFYFVNVTALEVAIFPALS